MNVQQINNHLLDGNLDVKGLFPKIEDLNKMPVQFKPEFGLDKLPDQPGLILVRGARQFGKSTWLELCLRESLPVWCV